MNYQVVFSREAEEDLLRLFEHALARELNSPSGDLDIPARAIDAIRQACRFLAVSPFSCRKATSSPFARELIVPFGASGFVVYFEIRAERRVHVGAVRHQRESDYH
ncbi:type II toxin-antitoxin system RelE/ParE family toxin [Rubrivivax sp. JA1024]|nr:type II toxin-antitoxin system RelE/ParE family toxin [Rubrivivax sp. JA1024]